MAGLSNSFYIIGKLEGPHCKLDLSGLFHSFKLWLASFARPLSMPSMDDKKKQSLQMKNYVM
jgi:hypothetical protein